MESEERDRVKITHYINPHMFWFKYETSCLTNTELFTWECDLQTHFFKLSRSPPVSYQPLVDEIVAILILSWNRWIRGKCDFISDATGGRKYHVWAIDYGVPFQVEDRWIRPLPEELKDGPRDSVYFGGLINVVPAQKIFNVDKLQSEIVPCDKWSSLAVTTIERLINDSEEIRFIRSKKSRQGQHFGNLEFITPTKKSIKADLILLEIDQAKAVTLHDFFILTEKLGTNKLPRWDPKIDNPDIRKCDTKEQVAKSRNEVAPKMSSIPINLTSEISDIGMDIERKCTDWEKRNELFRMQDEITIDDITFNDSVSVRNEPVQRAFKVENNIEAHIQTAGAEINENESEDEADIQVMQKAGTLKHSMAKYINNLPRLPSESDSSKASVSITGSAELKQSPSSQNMKNTHPSPELESRVAPLMNNSHTNRLADKRKSVNMKIVQETPKLGTGPVDLSSEAIKSQNELNELQQNKADNLLNSSGSSTKSQKSNESRNNKTFNKSESNNSLMNSCDNKMETTVQTTPEKYPEFQNTSSISVRNRFEKKLDTVRNVVPAGFDLRNLQPSNTKSKIKYQNSDLTNRTYDADLNDSGKNKTNSRTSSSPKSPEYENRYNVSKGSELEAANEWSAGNDPKKPAVNESNTNATSKVQVLPTDSGSGKNFDRKISRSNSRADRDSKPRRTHATNKITINDLNEQCLHTNLSKHLVLVHGKRIAKPIDKFASANFCEEVHQELEHMRLNQIYRIQSYTWPHIMRGNSSIVVSSARTGRTMSYLPAICSLIKMESDEGLVPDTIGPIGIIVAPSAVEVERIGKLCRRFLHGSATKIAIVEAHGIYNSERATRYLLNGCEVLVATPPSLTRLIASKLKLFDSKRLKHLVIDNIDFMQEQMKSELHEILRFCCGPKMTTVQLVVIAKYWNPILMGFLNLGSNAQLCIGAYIEAAVYARALINIKFIRKKSKAHEVIDFINRHPSLTERLVVVCNRDDEVEEVVDALKSRSLFFVACSSRSTAEEIELTKEWHKRIVGEMVVLVCTDDVLPELKVSGAQNIIHYSLPQSWTKFSYRFSILLGYFEDFIKSSVATKSPSACLILLDENNNTQLPKLINFLQIHNVENIPKEIYHLCEKIQIQREEERISENREFCPKVLEFGKCFSIDDCAYRHELTRFDKPEKHLPVQGNIKVTVLNIVSPTHYTVRLLEHQQEGENVWKMVRGSNQYLKFSLQLAQYFADNQNHQMHWPIAVGDLCAVSESNRFYRAKVLYVGKSKNVNLIMDVNCRVKLVDAGKVITCKSSHVLVLPDEFHELPHQAIHLRLSGIIPYDYEPDWSTNSIDTIHHWLKKYTKKAEVVGKIKFSLMDTIWVENIKLVEKLDSIKTYVTSVNIKSSLLEKRFATINNDAEDFLKEKAAQCGIFHEVFPLANGNSQYPGVGSTTADDEIKPAKSEGSICSSVTSQDLEKEKTKFLNQSSNKLLATKERGGNTECDVKSSSTKTHELKEQIKKDSNSNRCIAEAEEIWENLIPDRFTRVLVGAFYNPNNFYVQMLTDLHSNEELYREIDRFVENHRQLVTNPRIGLNCLAKCEGKYNRAKITKVHCDGHSNELHVSIFFCDIGLNDTVPLSAILNSSEYLIKMLPFQAIRCRMIGIASNMYGIWAEDICDRIYDEIIDQAQYLYARPVISVRQDAGLLYWKCDVVLLDCTNEADININDKLVACGYARYDKETEHYLSIVANFKDDVDDLSDSTDSNWDNCNYISPKFAIQEFNSNCGLDAINTDFDIEFSQEDILQLLNLPPTAKILPPEPRQTQVISSPGTELIVRKKSLEENKLDQQKISLYYKNKALDQNANIASIESSESDRKEYITMPRLKSLFKGLPVSWQQSESLISLQITAPDIQDYFLKVTSKSFIFITKIDNESKVIALNFCGCVKPQLVSHKICGLKVIVRLPKAIKGLLWPRLTYDGDKSNWIKYNYDSIVIEQETLSNIGLLNRKHNALDSSTDSEDENYEGNLDMQFNDEYDPFQDEFTY